MNNNRKNLIDALGAIGLRDLKGEEMDQARTLLDTLSKNTPEEEVKRPRKKRAPSQKAVAVAAPKVEPVVKAQPEPVVAPTPLEIQVEKGVVFEDKKPKKAPALKVEKAPKVEKVPEAKPSKIEQIAAEAKANAESGLPDGPSDDSDEDDVKEIAHDDLPEHLR